MGSILTTLINHRFSKISVIEKHQSYPDRFLVPIDKISWDTPFPEYLPVEFNAPVVLDSNTPWADPQDIGKVNHSFVSFEGEVRFNKEKIPLNPFGRTGIAGRGVLGKWGANFAVDGLITTINPETEFFQVLTIVRSDTGQTAFPGGMVDLNETAYETRNRELSEELSLKSDDLLNPVYEKIVYRGYVVDPRNTDNSWMEATVIHTHLSFDKAKNMALSAGDDAKSYKWIDLTIDCIGNFYASHGYLLILALKQFIESEGTFLNEKLRSGTQEFLKLIQ
jgi:ADP-ribose pyrophosphatase